MRWDDLQFFLAVARTGGLASAARQRGVDATTVGRRIRRLEHELGGQTLFIHSRNGHRLTAAGHRLLVHVEAIEREAGAMLAGDQTSDQTLRGQLRISASEGFGTWLIGSYMAEFTAAHPNLTVDLAANTGFLDPWRHEADVAISFARPKRGALVTRKLTDYRLRLYAAPAYLQGRASIRTAADLIHHTVIGYIPDLLYASELDYLDEVHKGLEARIRCASINTQSRLISGGAGVGVLPCFMGDNATTMVRVLPDIVIDRSFWLVLHEDSRSRPRVTAFISWLSEMVKKQTPRLLGDLERMPPAAPSPERFI